MAKTEDLTPRILEVLARLSGLEPPPVPGGGPARVGADSGKAGQLRHDSPDFAEALACILPMPLEPTGRGMSPPGNEP